MRSQGLWELTSLKSGRVRATSICERSVAPPDIGLALESFSAALSPLNQRLSSAAHWRTSCSYLLYVYVPQIESRLGARMDSARCVSVE